MQSSHSTDQLYLTENKHKPVKHVRSHEISPQKTSEQHLSLNSARSTSSHLKDSLRNLTSCALLKRKSNRTTHLNVDDSITTNEMRSTRDNESTIFTKRSIPSNNSQQFPTSSQTNGEQNSSGSSSRKSSEKKMRKSSKKISETPTTTTASTVNEKHSPVPLTDADDSFRKEISSSLVNLLGAVSEPVTDENPRPMPTQQLRHILSMPVSSVDPLTSRKSTGNIYSTAGITTSQTTSSISFSVLQARTSNEYSWCYENNDQTESCHSTTVDQCLPHLEIDEKPFTYRQQFQATEHFNWYGVSEIDGPVVISYKHLFDENKQRKIVGILRTRLSTFIENFVDEKSTMTSSEILRRLCELCSINDIDYFDPVLSDGTQDLLIKYDESFVSNQHKFGIIYQKKDQSTEEDIFSNESHNSAMDKFLDLIGHRVKLKDFQGYRAGLDVKSDFTGIESIYEEFQNHQIMFHVSTLLPHSKIERQQLERKRHIGNDIVAIVFQEKETKFNPEWIASQFLHVYLVVSPVDDEATLFQVSLIYRDSVPSFGPNNNCSSRFSCDSNFKNWLLTKLINAEMASCRSTTFQKYQERTRKNLFENLYRTLHENNRPFMNFILFYSQYKHECDLEQQQKDETQLSIQAKGSERHTDSSLLGSVRRRFIASKSRPQNSISISSPSTAVASPSLSNQQQTDSKPRTRTMTMDIKHNSSKDSTGANGKSSGLFSSFKYNQTRAEKSSHNRSTMDADNAESLNNSSKHKILTATQSLSPTLISESNHSEQFCPSSLSVRVNSIAANDIDEEFQQTLLLEDLQSLSKEDLIKFIVTLQQQSDKDMKGPMIMPHFQFSTDQEKPQKRIYGNSV